MASKVIRDVYIVAAARTPTGAFQGALSSLTATDLGAKVIQALLSRSGVQPDAVQEVFMGNVVSANLGQAPASQAAIKGGLPASVPCTTVNKVCSSGLKAIMLAAQCISTGAADVVVAGGMESMSNIPHYLPKSRTGTRLGHCQMMDGLIRDGLTDSFKDIHMGECAELCAEKYGISREQQDAHALASFERAQAASASGALAWEIAPVEVGSSRRGEAPRVVREDEPPGKLATDKLKQLKPCFVQDNGTVTAGNSSSLADGASGVMLMSAEAAQRLRVTPLARILGFADANQESHWFSTSPTLAVQKLAAQCGVDISAVEYWEVNEAFSVVDLANRQLLNLPDDRVNVHGGAVALGHPIGASGARILVSLLNVLRLRGARLGCAAVCNGGGGASAMLVEWQHA